MFSLRETCPPLSEGLLKIAMATSGGAVSPPGLPRGTHESAVRPLVAEVEEGGGGDGGTGRGES